MFKGGWRGIRQEWINIVGHCDITCLFYLYSCLLNPADQIFHDLINSSQFIHVLRRFALGTFVFLDK